MTHPITLFDNGSHQVYQFPDLVEGEGVQANQYLVVHGKSAALIEPGGILTAARLMKTMKPLLKQANIEFVFASHQDPDVISSVSEWLDHTEARLVISRIWSRFLPHLLGSDEQPGWFERLVAVPDEGMVVPFAGNRILCLPAHFMHSPGNLSFYDPVSKILFSGDIGSSMCEEASPVEDFSQHLALMAPFHRRFMASNQVCRWWVNMVRQLDVSMIMPQHGRPLCGPAMIGQFLDWLEQLQCGADWLTEKVFQCPE